MSQTTGPWSVKGIDARAREAARERARQEGMTLGEYLNSLILKGGEVGAQDIVAPIAAPKPRAQAGANSLNKLVSRIEAAEARSTLAITGIDQSVVGLLKRIEDAETEHIAMARHVDGVIDDIRSTYDALRDKVRRMEEDDSAEQNLEALKALENALGKLASHVYEESALAQNESEAIKGRVESGFIDVNERLESIDTKVEKTLTDAARRVEKAVEQAELRAEGTARHLSERMSTLDTKIGRQERNEEEVNKRLQATEDSLDVAATQIREAEQQIERQERIGEDLDGRVQEAESRIGIAETAIEDAGTRVDAIEGDVTTALESMEGTLLRVQDRLNRAETTTDAALKSLESTFDILDQRIGEVAKAAPEQANELRTQFEERFEGLADDLRASIAATREELAGEIEKAAKAGITPDQIATFETRLTDVQQRLSENDERHANAIGTVGEQVNRISENFDQRLQDVEGGNNGALVDEVREEVTKLTEVVQDRLEILEEREATAIERVGDEMTKIADQLDERITTSEQRSASAIEQVGEQVSRVATRLQSRQDEALQAFSERLEETHARSETRLSDALSNVSERLELMQSQSSQTLSPVQKAIASLATRLDSLEEFAAPPFADASRAAALPEMHPLPINDPLFTDAVTSDSADTELPISSKTDHPEANEVSDTAAQTATANAEALTAETSDDFEPGIESWNDVRDETTAKPEDTSTYTAEVPPADIYTDGDPVSELENWDDSASEARDMDVFDEDIETPEDETEIGAKSETPNEETKVDYLSAARAAALSAAEGTESPARRKKPKEKAKKAEKAAPVLDKSNDGGSSKLPLIATASVVALAAAGGTAYYAMKDSESVELQKINTPQMPEQIASKSSDTLFAVEATPAEAANQLASFESELFDETEVASTAILANTTPVSADNIAPITSVKAELAKAAPTPPAAKPKAPTPAASVAEPAPAPKPARKVKIARIDVPVSVESAASAGDTKAIYTLAKTKIDTGDYAEGAALMRRSAEAGEPAAQYRLGKLHEKGLGVPRDLTLARKWTESAANGGNIRAMHDLAVFYAQGDGGPQSYAAAVNWFRKAAEFGVVDSQYNLGVLYERGIGIDPDPAEALFWFVVATRGGDSVSSSKIQELTKMLPVDVASQTNARAQSWNAKPASGQANGLFPGQNWGGVTKNHIAKVQSSLNALGYEAGRADGSVGPATKKAIQLFQHDNGMKSTGDVTVDLIKKINEFAVT